MTLFCPLTTTGALELVTHEAGERKFVVDCNVNPTALVAQLRMTLVPEAVIVSCGGGNGSGRTLKKNGSMLDDRSNPFEFCTAASPLPAKAP